MRLAETRPDDLGLDAERLARAVAVLRRGVEERAFPGAVAVVARRGGVALRVAVGGRTYAVDEPDLAPETIYDLASLTKVVACLPAVLTLVERGLVAFDEPVVRHFPAFASADDTRRVSVTIRHLLTHTSGLPAWLPLYTDCASGADAVARICRTPLEAEPGSRVVYSDLGFILLGELVSQHTGQPLDRAVTELVSHPLGLADTGYLPAPASWARVAPTEIGEGYEATMARERGGRHPTRRGAGAIRGQVHDGNAYYALGGVSGHAGLFGTADDLARYCQLWLNGGVLGGVRLLSPALVATATRDHTAALNTGRGLGWAMFEPDPLGRRARWLAVGGDPALVNSGPAASGELLAPGSFGHTGFTGTSLWLDPARELAIVLLTNRVHPDASNLAIARVRARFHNAVVAAVTG